MENKKEFTAKRGYTLFNFFSQHEAGTPENLADAKAALVREVGRIAADIGTITDIQSLDDLMQAEVENKTYQIKPTVHAGGTSYTVIVKHNGVCIGGLSRYYGCGKTSKQVRMAKMDAWIKTLEQHGYTEEVSQAVKDLRELRSLMNEDDSTAEERREEIGRVINRMPLKK